MSEERWESVLRGLEKSKTRFLLGSALLVSPVQPWLTFNLMYMFFSTTLMSTFVLLGLVSMYYARNDLVTFVEIAHAQSFIISLWILVPLHFICNVPALYQILELIDTDVFVYKTVHGREEDAKFRIKMQKYAIFFQNFFQIALVIVYLVTTIVSPLLISMFGDGDRTKIYGINYNLPIPFWFPFNTETRSGFFVAYFLFCGEIAVVLFYVGTALPFLVFIACEVGAQFRILHYSILNIESRAIERYNWHCQGELAEIETLEGDALFKMCIRECLKENILHHIEIVRFFTLFQSVTSTILGIAIGVSMIFLASLSFVLTKIQILSFEAVKFTLFLVLEFMFVFGYCFMGSSLTEASRQIPDALYDWPWYRLLGKEKTTLRIFQNITANRLILLKGNGLFLIDLQLFVQIVRTTYSIFNIFSSSEN